MTTEGRGVCDDDSDFMLVNIVKKPTVDTGPDQTICQGETIQINATAQNYDTIQWTKTGGNGTFLNDDQLTPTYIASENDVGPILLTMTATPMTANGVDPCGGQVSQTMQLFIEAKPTVTIGPDQTICEGEEFEFNPTNVSAANYLSLIHI